MPSRGAVRGQSRDAPEPSEHGSFWVAQKAGLGWLRTAVPADGSLLPGSLGRAPLAQLQPYFVPTRAALPFDCKEPSFWQHVF